MPNIPALLESLTPEALATLRERGPDQVLDRSMVEAIDRAAGGPGEGRGYYVVRDRREPLEHPERRQYYLREDVAAAIFAVALEGASGADS